MVIEEDKQVNVEGDVIIARNPCLHPGDVKKMKAVSAQTLIDRCGTNKLKHIINCIVFP